MEDGKTTVSGRTMVSPTRRYRSTSVGSGGPSSGTRFLRRRASSLGSPYSKHSSARVATTLATGHWTEQEHKVFLRGLEAHGKKWKLISNMIPTRTMIQVRTHAQKYFLKMAVQEKVGVHEATENTQGPRPPSPKAQLNHEERASPCSESDTPNSSSVLESTGGHDTPISSSAGALAVVSRSSSVNSFPAPIGVVDLSAPAPMEFDWPQNSADGNAADPDCGPKQIGTKAESLWETMSASQPQALRSQTSSPFEAASSLPGSTFYPFAKPPVEEDGFLDVLLDQMELTMQQLPESSLPSLEACDEGSSSLSFR